MQPSASRGRTTACGLGAVRARRRRPPPTATAARESVRRGVVRTSPRTQRGSGSGEFLPGAPRADPAPPALLAGERPLRAGLSGPSCVRAPHQAAPGGPHLPARPDGGAASSSSGGSSSRRARQRGARAVRAADLAGGREPDMGGGPGHISAGGRPGASDVPAGPGRRRRGLPAARGAPGGRAPREAGPGPRPTRVPPRPRLDARARGGSPRLLVPSRSSFQL